MTENLSNWAASFQFGAARIHYPQTVDQLRELAARSTSLKAVGTRHSFNEIADTRGELISLERLPRLVSIDCERRTVTLSAGVRYGDLCEPLHRAGLALHNMASLPHISVAGACATATHGSGDYNRCLAAAVSAIEIVTASGELLSLSREGDGDLFAGAVVGLGALGLVTQITLDLVPGFEMRQDVYESLPLSALEADLDKVTSSAYSVSLFTDWRAASFGQVWLKRRLPVGAPPAPEPELLGAKLARSRLHPIAELSAESCTEQLSSPGPWHERMPHFRMEFTPSCGEELQSEYLVAREHGWEALSAVHALGGSIAPLLQISEIRTIAADDLWMSPFYHRDSLAIHFTWRKDWPSVQRVLPAIEEALSPFGARPHWGKLFTMPPERLRSLYERLPDFQQLRDRFDPEGKFNNPFLDTYLPRKSTTDS